MRACFIGNSYLVALKNGLDLEPSPLTGNVSFIFAPGSELQLTVDSESIVPTAQRAMISYASGVVSGEIKLADYDLFVVIGLGFGTGHCARMYRHWCLAKHMAGQRPISRAALAASITGMLKQTRAAAIVTQLRHHTARPIYLVPQPNPVGSLREAKPASVRATQTAEFWKPLFDDAVALELYEIYQGAANRAAHGLGALLLEQPADTRDPFFTREEYRLLSRDGKSFQQSGDKRVDIEDYGHMNAAFGRRIIAEIESAILPWVR